MSSGRDRQLQTAKELDKASTVLIKVGVDAVKRNPIKTGAYLLGLLLCLFFNGLTITQPQREAFYQDLKQIDHDRLDSLQSEVHTAYNMYYRSKGWFSCDQKCQMFYTEYQNVDQLYQVAKKEEDQKLYAAKAKLGLFSEYGVEETRQYFWEKFAQGKGFATRQTKWDALFMGISAMSRDENLISYLLRVALSMLFNFTIGMFGAVIAFIFGLGYILQSFQAGFLSGTIFFLFASLAAISFAISWLIGLYALTAGTAYVGLKLVASNMRLENGPNGNYSQRERFVQ
jgi:hypothetical protein